MTVWVIQEPTRRVNGQVVSLFERELAEKHGQVRMLIGANAKIEDPSVQRELWENIEKIDPDNDKIILAGNTAIIFAVGYMVSAIHPGKLNLLTYHSKQRIDNKLVQQPMYRKLVLDFENVRPDTTVDA